MAAVGEHRLLESIRRLNEIGIALSRERDEERLLERILDGAMDLTGADAGTVYSVVDDEALRFRIMRTDSLGISLGGSSGRAITLPDVRLHREDGSPNHASVVAHAVLEHTTIVIDDAYETEDFDFSGTRAFDERTGYRSRALLTVPMRDHEQVIIGVLQLLNPRDANGADVTFDPAAVELVESLASQASITLSNGALIDEVSTLFESFVKLIARAIDEKSPYTGGHCRRVPELTMRLAAAASDATTGPLADFRMDEQDRYELLIASWLHDCGKITTPEWVMDKATKLERIHDRIDEVATRLAVCKREAEYRCLVAIAEGADPGQCQQALRLELDAIDADLAFLRTANVGGERMSDDDVARVERIARREWVDVEGARMPLLNDDELRNLTIRKGTLLPEEREVINHHIVATITMLEALPFPRHLRNVPEIAGGHHERMDGKGYPKGLTRDEMSVQARCMGIADVFEALTAADRPYKPPMTVSTALTILGRMKLDGHIDPDLFNVFIASRIWEDYAREFLQPEQIDEVDLATIPGVDP